MDKLEARRILALELEKYREKPYLELARITNRSREYSVTGPSGEEYHIEIEAFWVGEKWGNLRILGLIDSGGWRSNFPIRDSFIKSPTESIYEDPRTM
jgi:hypothetical protein